MGCLRSLPKLIFKQTDSKLLSVTAALPIFKWSCHIISPLQMFPSLPSIPVTSGFQIPLFSGHSPLEVGQFISSVQIRGTVEPAWDFFQGTWPLPEARLADSIRTSGHLPCPHNPVAQPPASQIEWVRFKIGAFKKRWSKYLRWCFQDFIT